MENKVAKIRYRILATIADTIVNAIAIALILLATSSFSILSLFLGNTAVINAAILIKLIEVGILIATWLVIYYAAIPLYTKGQTLGYFIFKIRIIQADGTNVTFLSLFVRYALGRLAITILTLGVGLIVSIVLMIYRDDNCAIQDILAKTIVVDA